MSSAKTAVLTIAGTFLATLYVLCHITAALLHLSPNEVFFPVFVGTAIVFAAHFLTRNENKESRKG